MKTLNKGLFLISLIVLLGGCGGGGSRSTASDPSRYSFSVSVVDSSGIGVRGVTIEMDRNLGTLTTDHQGLCSYENATGTITITPKMEGWSFYPSSIQVTKKNNTVEFHAGRIVNVPADYSSIQLAIDHARQRFDVIVVAPGTYRENIRIPNTIETITIRSTDPANPSVVASTIIDGSTAADKPAIFYDNSYGVYRSILDGLTVTKGNRGVYILNSTVEIKNCLITNNQGSLMHGGGVEFSSGGVTYIHDSIFRNNSGDYGGAICSYDTVYIYNNTFENNTAVHYGGAILASGVVGAGNESHIYNNTFISNTAAKGGGIFASKAVLVKDNNEQPLIVPDTKNTYQNNTPDNLYIDS